MADAAQTREVKGWRLVYLIYGLYVLGWFSFGFAAIVGVILAHLKEGTAATPSIDSHLSKQIRIFWTSIALGFIGIILSILGIGWLILLGVWVYFIWATATGLFAAMSEEPVRP